MHELYRSWKKFLDPWNCIIFDLNIDLEALDIDIRRKFIQAFVEIFNDVIHENKHVVFVILQARQVGAVIIQFVDCLIDLWDNIFCAILLQD